jgi:hypothetical protein
MNQKELSEMNQNIYKEGGHNDLSSDEHLPDFPAPQGPDVGLLVENAKKNQWRKEGGHDFTYFGTKRKARRRQLTPLNFD